MRDFSISFVQKPPSRISYDLGTEAVGKVLFGDFEEHFIAWLGFWKLESYETQWREGLGRVLAGQPSCLITNMYGPDWEYIMRAWLLYPTEPLVLIHEKIFLADQLDAEFSLKEPYQHIPSYQSHSDDGEKFSEWRVESLAIERFLDTMSGET